MQILGAKWTYSRKFSPYAFLRWWVKHVIFNYLQQSFHLYLCQCWSRGIKDFLMTPGEKLCFHLKLHSLQFLLTQDRTKLLFFQSRNFGYYLILLLLNCLSQSRINFMDNIGRETTFRQNDHSVRIGSI